MNLRVSAGTANPLGGQELSRRKCNPQHFNHIDKGCPRPRVTIHYSLASLRSVLSNTTQHI